MSSRRDGGRFMTAEGKAYKEQCGWEAKTQWNYGVQKRAFAIRVDFFFKTRRKRDLDNQNKIILDALTGIVYEDDSQIDELHLVRHLDTERPRVEITAVPL
jgi:crossover junction endodeoxyribonuclease RusA